MIKKIEEKYYVFRARCIINADNYGELKFLTHDEWYRKFGKENPAFLFEFVSDKFDINTFTENLKYPLYATQQFNFFQVFFILHEEHGNKDIRIVFFDRRVGNWVITDITNEYFIYWNDFSGDEFDEFFDRLYLFVDNFSTDIRTQKRMEKEYLSNALY